MNIYNELQKVVQEIPQKEAASESSRSFPWSKYKYPFLTFTQMEARIEKFASVLIEKGVKKDDKVLLFVKPKIDFPCIVFAVFKIGAIPVLIDPGMGKKNLLSCIKQVQPDVLIAEPIVHLFRIIYSSIFKSCRLFFSTLTFKTPFSDTLYTKKNLPSVTTQQKGSDELAAILFTSGGTGKPKGVIYTHSIFIKQTAMLKEMFSLNVDDVDIPGFPLFSLFTLCIGMKSVVPDMNPSRPAKADPKKLIQNIIDNKATFVAGSPAIWERVADYCIKNKVKLDTVKYLVMFGAPVNMRIHQKFSKVLTNGNTFTPYGATESLPLSNISGKEFINICDKTYGLGKGTCVGQPAPGISIKIIPISDGPFERIEDVTFNAPYEIGEILVSGPPITPGYYQLEKATKLAKIYDGETIWHRMGDIGYLDEEGRLWFCGRKSHLIKTKEKMMYTIPVEEVFNCHPKVKRTAVVGVGKFGKQRPVLFIERWDGKTKFKSHEKSVFEKELKTLGSRTQDSQKVEEFLYADSFPVDVRHNIKIDRLKLKRKAEEQCKFW